MAAPMRPMTSAATAVCGLRAADVAMQAPVCRSNSLTASVVVPTSTAAPYRPGIGRSASARTPVPVSICSSRRLSAAAAPAAGMRHIHAGALQKNAELFLPRKGDARFAAVLNNNQLRHGAHSPNSTMPKYVTVFSPLI